MEQAKDMRETNLRNDENIKYERELRGDKEEQGLVDSTGKLALKKDPSDPPKTWTESIKETLGMEPKSEFEKQKEREHPKKPFMDSVKETLGWKE